jgi:DNA polymerase-4
VASDAEKPRGFVVLSSEQARVRFAGSACGLIPGIGPKTVERLRACGLPTLGQLATADPPALAERFGLRMAAELQRRARFEDEAPVTQERKVISESRETTFDVDVSGLAALEPILAELVTKLCTGLERQQRRGRTVGIKVRLDDFSTHTRARTLAEAVSSADRVGPVALDLLHRFAPDRPVRLLGVRVAGLESSGPDSRAEQLVLSI